MTPTKSAPTRSNFRRFFFRGLAILLPTVLTIYILVLVYGFVDQRIASPINRGLKTVIVTVTPWPHPAARDFLEADAQLTATARAEFVARGGAQELLAKPAQRFALERVWNTVAIGSWAVLDLIGLVIAILLIYVVGYAVGGFIGLQFYKRGEEVLRRVPIFKAVYPHVKQVTDFLVGGDDNKKMQFTRVVALQYPRKDVWSLGLVTGEALRSIQEGSSEPLVTVFVPASPPISGFIVTARLSETIEMPMTIDDALRFIVTAGVIVPDSQASQRIPPVGSGALPPPRPVEMRS